jgi:GNAT superfamily N-acetyltransferase
MHSEVDPAHVQEACAVLADGGVSMLKLMSFHHKLTSGELRAELSRGADGPGVVVLSERGTWRQVLIARGPESSLLAGLTELRSSSEALMWDEDALQVESSKLDALGFRLLHRQVFTQELARVPMEHPDPGDLEVALLEEGDRAGARKLFALTHATSVEGLYATWPLPPTVEECGVAFDGYLGGVLGAVVPTACVVVRNQGRVVGVICCAFTDDRDEAILLGLAVDPAERGRGLSRILVRRAQKALKAAGFARMLFLTTDRNTPVHRLFTLEEIIKTETFPTRLWLKDSVELPARPA